MHAENLIKLIQQKYQNDTVISQCKTDSTYGGSFSQFDCWVAHKTWGTPTCTGFEVKVSRSDFLNDRKWQDYLPHCQAFYFVSPAKVIRADEVPAEAGLMWASANGTCLFTKKKAPVRNIIVSPDVYHYVLMHRIKPKTASDIHELRERNLIDAANVRQNIKDYVGAVRSKERDIDDKLRAINAVEEAIKTMGFPHVSVYNAHEIAQALVNVSKGLDPLVAKEAASVARSVRMTLRSMDGLADSLEKIAKGTPT